jgi:hypothetical protein
MELAWELAGDGKRQGVIWHAGKNAWALREGEHWQEQVAVGQRTARSGTGPGWQARGDVLSATGRAGHGARPGHLP